MTEPEKDNPYSNKPEEYLGEFDIWAIIKRREIILTLIIQGKIDPEAGMAIYEGTATLAYREEEHKALLAYEEYLKTGENLPHYEESPMARLFEQLIRLNPQYPPFVDDGDGE